MMRNLDKLLLLCGGMLVLLALLLNLSSIMSLNGDISRATEDAYKLVEDANNNSRATDGEGKPVDGVNNGTAPPQEGKPLNISGKVFAAWETPPLIIHPYTPNDFFPSPGK